MTPPPPSAPDRDEPSGPSVPAPTWAADMAEAPAVLDPRLPPGQMALFSPEDLAPAPASGRARRKRLPGPIKALLTAIEQPARRTRHAKPADPAAGTASSSWPDSFFDAAPDS
ncbi:MAG: hypothetical protein ABJD97_21955 [Betaproteobacteria bacterium]